MTVYHSYRKVTDVASHLAWEALGLQVPSNEPDSAQAPGI